MFLHCRRSYTATMVFAGDLPAILLHGGGYQSNRPSGAQNFTISVPLDLVKHFTVFAKAPIFPLMRLLTIDLSFVVTTLRYSRTRAKETEHGVRSNCPLPRRLREFSGLAWNGGKELG